MCNFDLSYSGSPDQLVSKAQQLVTQAGGRFEGSTEGGTYSLKIPVGQIAGEYVIQGSTVSFKVTKKPMLVPCSAIEAYLRNQLTA